ncbi:SGNH/GDSL hydrolase family protein [Proteus myxofaciens]|uniref:SGNH/GDSL hydrolase family protein n=1 Tax=Proteus myxofaciens TaxID=184072 RepID=UPI0008317486|nr:SGNH/GDSL hydrolase family protein [Proteus myxofaciens]
MKHIVRILKPKTLVSSSIILALVSLLVACNQDKEKTVKLVTPTVLPADGSRQLYNFYDPNFKGFVKKLQQGRQNVHIVQLGDSHTAADFFSGKLRERFQADYGDGGIGFIPPTNIPGQRTANVQYQSDKKAWGLISSRKDTDPDFPLGGFISVPESKWSTLQLAENPVTQQQYQLQALYKAPTASQINIKSSGSKVLSLTQTHGQWQFSRPVSMTFPVSITVNKTQPIKLGGWLITNQKPGVMLSTLGINGASINMLDKWGTQWSETLGQLKPDMVILAYGTNEAFNDTFDLDAYRQLLTEKIRQIRRVAPNSAILLVGPSDSIKNKDASDCRSQQPQWLTGIVKIQKEVAQQEKTLFWDWRDYMGGECSIKAWSLYDLARPDGVHLSREGYESSANTLYSQLSALINKS